jgi:hypothetical protein
VRSVEVIVMEEGSEEGGAVVRGVVGASVGPFAGDGLDEAFGLAIGLGSVGSGEGVLEAEFAAGGGEEFGAVGGAAVGEEAFDGDAVLVVEGDGLAEGVEDAGGLFIREEGGEGDTGVVIDGDMEGLGARAGIAMGAVAGGADAWFGEAAELLDVEVEEVARVLVLVALGRRLRGFEGGEAVEAVAAEDAREGGLGDREEHADLGVGAALAAECEDLGFEGAGGLAGLAERSGGTVFEACGKAELAGASEPSADGLFADAEGGGGGAQGGARGGELGDHFCSHERGENGISVHVVRAACREVACSSTTTLPDQPRADNLLKHDT